MDKVFVAHPGLQHAHQLAWAVSELGLLQGFWSGVPVMDKLEELPFWLPTAYTRRVKKVRIPIELRRHPLIFQLLLRLGAVLPEQFSHRDYQHRVFHLFDWWIARQIPRLRPTVVVAYENSAYHTFKAAKVIGARCVLDASSMPYATEPTPYLEEIIRRKAKEIALADLILTCSPLAAENYILSGVQSYKVFPVLLGASLPKEIGSWQIHNQPLHFIFAGVLSKRKSVDLILSAFKRLHNDFIPFQLSFVGGQGEPGWVEQIKKVPGATYYKSVPQVTLYKLLSTADCLLLPSRSESFGMVVAEALACGTPVIVSTQTGARAIIEQFPGAGWVVECDEGSLYKCIKARIENRTELFSARSHALEASRHFTWEVYRRKVGQFLKDWLN
jgi:glycosyltransferase involved in cell wall biosynthesis